MTDETNPLGREYSHNEISAGLSVGMASLDGGVLTGQMIWATGNFYPEHAREMADKWALVADALEREFGKEQDQ